MENEKKVLYGNNFFEKGIKQFSSFWIQKRRILFVVFFVFINGVAIWVWYQNFYLLGKDKSRIDALMKEKNETLFREDLYNTLSERFILREQKKGLDIEVRNLFLKRSEKEEIIEDEYVLVFKNF